MQWPNGSGGGYGEDPYAGAGYAYAPGHEGGTAAPAWEPVRYAQWTQPQPQPPYPTAWDAAHGDVLTAPYPEVGLGPVPFVPEPEPAPEPAPGLGPKTPESESARPVFVDASGRRQRRVLRAARLLVIPAGGYVALLISTMLGGPSISAPFVPQPDATHPAAPRVSAPHSPSGAAHRAGNGVSTGAHAGSRPAAQRTASGPTGSATAPTAPAAPAATSGPTTAATGTTAPAPGSTAAPTPTTTRSSKGRAVGSSHNPVK